MLDELVELVVKPQAEVVARAGLGNGVGLARLRRLANAFDADRRRGDLRLDLVDR